MNAIEAIIYCLGYVHVVAEDGEYRSAPVYDINGEPHWVAWEASPWKGKSAVPRFCSGSPTPFTEALEPYGQTYPFFLEKEGNMNPCRLAILIVDALHRGNCIGLYDQASEMDSPYAVVQKVIDDCVVRGDVILMVNAEEELE